MRCRCDVVRRQFQVPRVATAEPQRSGTYDAEWRRRTRAEHEVNRLKIASEPRDSRVTVTQVPRKTGENSRVLADQRLDKPQFFADGKRLRERQNQSQTVNPASRRDDFYKGES